MSDLSCQIGSPMTMTKDTLLRQRNPDKTRQRILEAAFQEIYRHGFQGTRMDDIVQATGLTKGALYHHFPNKQNLGYAVVEEVVLHMLMNLWDSVADSDQPLERIIDAIRRLDDHVGPQIFTLGCPLNNLAQEMSPLDEGFRSRIDEVYRQWHKAMLQALERARDKQQLREGVDLDDIATFLLGALSGCIGLAKNAQSRELYQQCSRVLVDFLESLRRPR